MAIYCRRMSNRANRVLEFGPFRLEAGERLLLRQNERIPLTPKAFETLLVLVEHSGRVVQKDDLLKQVWPDTIVEEANLARNIWTLRKVLADGNGESTYIETIPKVGYRFIAPVTELPVETESVVIRRQVSAPSVTQDPKVPDAPLPTTPTRRRGLAFVFVLSLLALAGVISVGLIRLGRAAPPAAVAGSGRAFLTDGSHGYGAAKSVPDFDRAIELKPDFRYAYINRANARLVSHPWLALQDFHHVGMYPERTAAKIGGVIFVMIVGISWIRRRRVRDVSGAA